VPVQNKTKREAGNPGLASFLAGTTTAHLSKTSRRHRLRNMPTLEFKGKSFVYTHHLAVPFRELVIDPKKSLPASGAKPTLEDNLIIHGDNLHALKALLPIYAGKVDCIVIDPPYNTGNEGWCYNDNVRSPLMRDWLKKASPVDKEDLERHDKWLCMMWPRLKLLHELLAEDGAIFICIDDNEVHRLRGILDDVFAATNFMANIVWQHSIQGKGYTEKFSVHHNHILAYVKKGFELKGTERGAEHNLSYSNPDNDPRGDWRVGDLRNALDRPRLKYRLPKPSGGYINPPEKGWRYKIETMMNKIKKGEVVFVDDETRVIRKIYLADQEDRAVETIWFAKDVGSTRDANKQLEQIFGEDVFETPKPTKLIQRILEIATDEDSIVLDSFAGTATTAHAVLAQNKKDGGNRKFILVECEDYADKLTAERVRRVIRGYKFEGTQREELMREPLTWTKLTKAGELLEKADSFELLDGKRFDRISKSVEDGALVVTGEKKITEKVEGLGGSFTFCTLGEEMGLDKLLAGEKLPSFDALAKYVFYTATGRTLQDVPKQKADSDGYIGETDLYRVHLLYRPEKAWLRSNDAALTEKLVARMVAGNKGKKRVLVFAAAKFMGQRELTRQGVEFCQLPYTIHRIMGD
jgi:adenine-specific DNA-methyltransferase